MLGSVGENPFSNNSYNIPVLDLLQVVMGFVGISLNVLLLISNYLRKESRWATDGLLISVSAFLDCIVGVFFVVGTSFRTASPSIVYDNSAWCSVSFVVGRTVSIACLDIVALLSLVRYFVIVKKHPPRPWLWLSISLLVLVCLLVVSLLRIYTEDLLVFPSKMYCGPIPNPSTMSKVLTHLTGWFSMPPLLIIPFCYIRLTVTYTRQILATYGGEVPINSRPSRRIFGMVFIIVAYFLALIPEYILLIALRIYKKPPSPVFDALSVTCYNLIPIINAVFPLVFHDEINKSYCRLMGRNAL